MKLTIRAWLDEAVNYITNTKCLFFLLGNKSDEKEKIVVENNEIKNFLRKNQKIKKYFEISAFNGHNVDLAFDKISQHLVIRFSGESMSTGNLNLDILLYRIAEDALSGRRNSISALKKQFPSLSEKELSDLHSMFVSLFINNDSDSTTLVATTPPSFSINAKSTKNTTIDLLTKANASILLTGYSLSDYFNDMVDCIVNKSQQGVLVKVFVNQIENQKNFDKLYRYKGRFLRIYNYTPSEDKMAALHAKVISTDQRKTLITSANLSYHGQEGNVELGALIESKKIAKQVEELFTKLLFKKIFIEI